MLVESLTGPVAVRLRTLALRFGDAMNEPLFGGVAAGFFFGGALSRHPQVDDFSHASPYVS
jgi:hypothetical protein